MGEASYRGADTNEGNNNGRKRVEHCWEGHAWRRENVSRREQVMILSATGGKVR